MKKSNDNSEKVFKIIFSIIIGISVFLMVFSLVYVVPKVFEGFPHKPVILTLLHEAIQEEESQERFWLKVEYNIQILYPNKLQNKDLCFDVEITSDYHYGSGKYNNKIGELEKYIFFDSGEGFQEHNISINMYDGTQHNITINNREYGYVHKSIENGNQSEIRYDCYFQGVLRGESVAYEDLNKYTCDKYITRCVR